jgi:hypothetical protein
LFVVIQFGNLNKSLAAGNSGCPYLIASLKARQQP